MLGEGKYFKRINTFLSEAEWSAVNFKKFKFDMKECLSKAHLCILYGNVPKYAEFSNEKAWKKLFSPKNAKMTCAQNVKSVGRSTRFNG